MGSGLPLEFKKSPSTCRRRENDLFLGAISTAAGCEFVGDPMLQNGGLKKHL